MSLLNQAEDQNFDRYAADFGEAYIFPLLSRPAGFTTDWCGIMHPLGLFKFDSFQSQGNAEALKDASFRRVSEEEEAPTGIFKPVEVGVTAGAKVVNSDGVKTGEMTDYLNNPLDATVENDGSIEFVRENGGEYQLRRGRNNHGQYLVKHFHEAMATSDAKALRALLHYVKFALGDDVSIDYEDISIEGNTARTMFLVDKIYGRSLESEEAQSQESGVAGVDA